MLVNKSILLLFLFYFFFILAIFLKPPIISTLTCICFYCHFLVYNIMCFSWYFSVFLQCFIQLAQGKLKPDQLTEDVLTLLSVVRSRHHFGDPSYPLEGGGKMSSEIIRMMQQLSDRALHAQQCCQCILSCFKIALVRICLCVLCTRV